MYFQPINDTAHGTADNNSAGLYEGYKTTATSSGTVCQIGVWINSGSTANSYHVAIYSDVTGTPTTKLAGGIISSPITNNWNWINVTPFAITSGTAYWPTIMLPSGGTGSPTYGTAGSSGGTSRGSAAGNATLPTTFAVSSSGTWGKLAFVAVGITGNIISLKQSVNRAANF